MASIVAASKSIFRTAEPRVAVVSQRPPLEYSMLLTATLCLLAGGAVMVYSASAPSTVTGGGSGTGMLVRFVGYGLVGLVVLRLASRRGLEVVRRFTGPLLAVSFLLLVAVRLPGVGRGGSLGSQRWIGVGPLQFQPSELAKLALILYAAHIFSASRPGPRTLKIAFRRLLVVGGCCCALVASQPDIGTTLVIFLALVAVVLTAGVRLRHLAIAGLVCAVLVGGFALLQPYATKRLTSFTNPWAHATTTGFQSVQSQIAIGSGGLLGRGPGASTQKDGWLPNASTDFILAVVGEELGFVGIAALLGLYGMIAFAGLRAARRAPPGYPMLVAVGVTAVILFQASLNVFAVLGLAPVTGVPLPFVSYGASNLLVMLGGMGLLLNVAGGGAVGAATVHRTWIKKTPRSDDARTTADRDRSRRDRGSRRARTRGGARAARARG